MQTLAIFDAQTIITGYCDFFSFNFTHKLRPNEVKRTYIIKIGCQKKKI